MVLNRLLGFLAEPTLVNGEGLSLELGHRALHVGRSMTELAAFAHAHVVSRPR